MQQTFCAIFFDPEKKIVDLRKKKIVEELRLPADPLPNLRSGSRPNQGQSCFVLVL